MEKGEEVAVTNIFQLPFFLAVISLLPGCGLYWNEFGPELHLYDGPKREGHEVATIDQGAGCYTCVESIRRFDQKDPIYTVSPQGWEPVGSGLTRPNKIIVSPGKYYVTLAFGDAPRSTGYVELQPGHTYQVLNDIFSGSEKAFVWMEDADTGEILLGEKM